MNKGSSIGSYPQILENFSWIYELQIINYELTTNYLRLIIKLELIIKQNYLINLF
jgi:hypothetical protein